MIYFTKQQGKQLNLFTEKDFSQKIKGVEEKEFVKSFKPYETKVIQVVLDAHDDVLRLLESYQIHGNKIKGQLLNDRIHLLVKNQIPELATIDDYDIVCLKLRDSILCTFKKIDNKLPSFRETKRAIEKFSQFRRNGSKLDLPYVVIGYRISPDFQQLEEVWAVKTKINNTLKRLEVDWSINLYDQAESSEFTIDSKSDSLKDMRRKDKDDELPDIKRKSS